tara:strand:+ start:190 stop:774 length:585 start_codon:yes stop_codon:yes gene_type:complete
MILRAYQPKNELGDYLMILTVYGYSKNLSRHVFMFFLIIGILQITTVWAHQGKTAVTTLLFNIRTNNIEVMHRFILHDAEHAVSKIFGKGADIINENQTRRQYASYVARRFSIVRSDGSLLPLILVGQEIDRGFLWVYQETPVPADLINLTIRHKALRDIWSDQINIVNIKREGKVETLTFRDGKDKLTIEFED